MSRRSIVLLAAASWLTLAAAPVAAEPQPAPASHTAVRGTTCTVIVDSAVVRDKPRTSATALGVVHFGDICHVHGPANGRWIKGTFTSRALAGYIRADLVSLGTENLTRT
ncbi:hypothetical protein H9Y04_43380 [Streptomyces sp. TRM66268-LWL]|uniref:SH3 domain-containing protein n=1 Tax=Streptomyces polyasparticus TaxID=2767826 RepID=A0ABR7SV43_9ACTN|nr:hypothetical protein [Streptomyces polyasparticus]MBC9719374.1 hypothetical protein [Streptomyces polyasparticus]